MRNIRGMKQIGWFFCLCPFILSAQEPDIFKSILKETLKPEFSFSLSYDSTNYIFPKKLLQWDITKDYIPRLSFNHKENLLFLSFQKDFSYVPQHTVSPYLLAPYTNQNVYDPNSTETTVDAITNIVITPLASIIMINPLAFFDYLMRAGALPGEPFVPKMSRKERMLKTITQDVYHIDDDY